MPTTPSEPCPTALIARHHGLDWLRIGAFALLILFHIGLYFTPGHWIVKSPELYPWVLWPIAAITPWRLTLLFAVSGYASAAMIQRHPHLAGFLIERTKRLLIPLAFGVLVVIPPQDWVRLEVAGVDHDFGYYLLHDNFAFATRFGSYFPNWEHLWFLPWLWAYTLALVAGIAAAARFAAPAACIAEWLSRGRRLLYLPAVAILAGMVGFGEVGLPGLSDSADYFPAFVFGYAYAHLPVLRAATARLAREALAVSAVALAIVWYLLAEIPADTGRVAYLLDLGSECLMSWAMMLALFHLADRFLAFDNRLRQPLAAAVFPAYIVHQTVIVLTGWYLARAGIDGLPALLAQLGTVVAACLGTWWIARSFPIMGVLLGMPPRRKPITEICRPQLPSGY